MRLFQTQIILKIPVEPEREKIQLSSQISAPSSTIIVVASAAPAAVQAAVANDSATAASSDAAAAATKKAIHLRLGAMTKTWKNKKSWRSEKVLIFSMIIKLNFLFYNFVQISVKECVGLLFFLC